MASAVVLLPPGGVVAGAVVADVVVAGVVVADVVVAGVVVVGGGVLPLVVPPGQLKPIVPRATSNIPKITTSRFIGSYLAKEVNCIPVVWGRQLCGWRRACPPRSAMGRPL
ncbi:MAG TPA: hypothetical protein VES66_02410 [Terriglobales bacterium]|nr:hypothetical protein [Terriglobales bacterium]